MPHTFLSNLVFVFNFLFTLFNLLDILIQNISETLPSTLWHKDGVAIVPLNLGDGHVAPLLVLLDVEVEVLVLNTYVFVLGSIHRILSIPIVILVNEFPKIVLELPHSVRGNKHLEPGTGVATSKSFRDLQKSSPCILLEIHVVLLVVLVHHLGPELALSQVVGIQLFQVMVEIDELDKVLAEERSSGKSHQDLILSSIS